MPFNIIIYVDTICILNLHNVAKNIKCNSQIILIKSVVQISNINSNTCYKRNKFLSKVIPYSEKFSRFSRILPKFTKLNPHEIFANSQITKFFENCTIAKINTRKIFCF